MNRAAIRDRILIALNESTSAPVFWSTAQVDASIVEALEVLSEEAQAVRRTAMVGLKPGSTYYPLRGVANDIMAPYRLWLPHLDRRLTAVTIGQLDRQNETWPTVTGDPEYWFPVSWDLFGVYPHPSAGGGMIRIDYLAWPQALAQDDDVPELRGADQDALVLYGVYDGLMKQWAAPQAIEMFARFMERWAVARDRHGMRENQARTYQVPQGTHRGFRSEVQR